MGLNVAAFIGFVSTSDHPLFCLLFTEAYFCRPMVELIIS